MYIGIRHWGVSIGNRYRIGKYTYQLLKIYLFKVNNKNTRKGCEICSKLTIKTPE